MNEDRLRDAAARRPRSRTRRRPSAAGLRAGRARRTPSAARPAAPRCPARRRACAGRALLAALRPLARPEPRSATGRRRLRRRGPQRRAGADRAPGGGQLLVQSRAGPLGRAARRLAAAARRLRRSVLVAARPLRRRRAGRTLSALEPDGTPHWSFPAPGPRQRPALVARRASASPTGAGDDAAGDQADGRGSPRSSRRSAVAPAWFHRARTCSPTSTRPAARSRRNRRGETLAAAPASAGVTALELGARRSAPARTVAERSSGYARLRTRQARGRLRLGAPRRVPLPPDAVRAAALSPDGTRSRSCRRHAGRQGPRSSSLLHASGGIRVGSSRARAHRPSRLVARRPLAADRLAGRRPMAVHRPARRSPSGGDDRQQFSSGFAPGSRPTASPRAGRSCPATGRRRWRSCLQGSGSRSW